MKKKNVDSISSLGRCLGCENFYMTLFHQGTGNRLVDCGTNLMCETESVGYCHDAVSDCTRNIDSEMQDEYFKLGVKMDKLEKSIERKQKKLRELENARSYIQDNAALRLIINNK